MSGKSPTGLSVYIEGTPIQQGSMKAFPIRRANGRLGVSMVHNKGNQLSQWRESIQEGFKNRYPQIMEDAPFFKQYVPIYLDVEFYLERPKSNKLSAPSNKKADLDKLIRAVNDALSGLVFYDDSQVVMINAQKKWATDENPVGVHIGVFNICN